MGGRIWVGSSGIGGEGASFSFTLQLASPGAGDAETVGSDDRTGAMREAERHQVI